MSVPKLIDVFMFNTCRAVHDWYKELKQRELTWEQFLTEVTVINNKEDVGILQRVKKYKRAIFFLPL